MKTLALILAIGLGLLAGSSASAADLGDGAVWRHNPSRGELPFPRSGRAEAVWSSLACWDACGADTAWSMAACLERDAQRHCLKWADAADRACQRTCRTRGGPFLSIDTLFPLGD